MPPNPNEPTGTGEAPPVAIALPPPAVLPPLNALPPPLGAVVQAKALRGAKRAKRKPSAPAAATLLPVLITWNTVLEFNAEVTEIWSR